jgi:hypothetical protein
VAGFRSALAQKASPSHLPDAPIHCFDAYMDGCTEADLREILTAVIGAYPPNHPEKPFLQREFQDHAALLSRSIVDSLGEVD